MEPRRRRTAGGPTRVGPGHDTRQDRRDGGAPAGSRGPTRPRRCRTASDARTGRPCSSQVYQVTRPPPDANPPRAADRRRPAPPVRDARPSAGQIRSRRVRRNWASSRRALPRVHPRLVPRLAFFITRTDVFCVSVLPVGWNIPARADKTRTGKGVFQVRGTAKRRVVDPEGKRAGTRSTSPNQLERAQDPETMATGESEEDTMENQTARGRYRHVELTPIGPSESGRSAASPILLPLGKWEFAWGAG